MPLNRVQFDSNNNVNVVGGLTAPNLVARQGTTGPINFSSSSSVLGTGMDLITPTSVVGATLSGGEVSFTAATIVSMNGCFTSTYQNYRVVLSQTAQSAGAMNYMRFRAAGADTSTSTYLYVYGRNSSTVNDVVGGTAAQFQTFYADATRASHGTIDIFRANSSANAGIRGQTFGVDGSFVAYNIGGLCTQATAHDGFTIYPNSGNITGTLRVYGLRNS